MVTLAGILFSKELCFQREPIYSVHVPLSYRLFLAPALAAALGAFAAVTVHAQTAAGSNVSCKIRTAEPGEVELAFAREDKNFPKLVEAAEAKEPDNKLYRELEVDYLLNVGKFDDAEKKVQAWTTASPNDAYAVLTASEFRHALGDWTEAYALALRALKIDPCLAPAFADLALFEEESGYRNTAEKHLALAHQLWPNDQAIRLQWAESLPYPERATQLKQYLTDSKAIEEKRRKQLVERFETGVAHDQDRCELASTTGPARIPMVLIQNEGDERWGVKVSFNGHERTLILDTGASGFLLSLSASSNLQLAPITNSRVGGFGSQGSTADRIMLAPTVQIGGLEFKNCVVSTLNSYGMLGASHMGMGQALDNTDGLLGSDVFERYLVTLDYIKHEIRLAPLPDNPAKPTAQADRDPLGGSMDPNWMLTDRFIAPEMKSWIKIYRDGHDLIIPAVLSDRGERPRPALFVADTGSAMNLIDSRAAKEWSKVQEGIGGISGLSGTSRLKEAGAFTIDFAGIRLPVKSMDSIDLTRFGGPVGFLGQPTLEQLVIHLDYRDNLALFEAPNGKKM